MATHASAAWAALPPGAARCLEMAHRSLVADGLAVGSAIVDESGAVVAEGRNRAYDAPTSTDPLERTPLAHAEMNAIARLDTDAPTDRLTLWSTQQPCPMCQAAVDFIGLPTVMAIASDPSSSGPPAREVLDDVWVVLATAMFLAGPLRRFGPTQAMVRGHATIEPEAVALAEQLAAGTHPLADGSDLRAAVMASWDELSSAAERRRRRRGPSR